MKKPFIILLFSLFGCSDLIDESHFEVDKRLLPFVNNFYNEARKNKINIQHNYLIALIDEQSLEINGSSEVNSSIPKIHINSKFFKENDGYVQGNDSIGFYSIQYVVFHELGHALLYRGHVSDFMSIMNPGGEGFTMDEYYSCDSVRVKLNKGLFFNK